MRLIEARRIPGRSAIEWQTDVDLLAINAALEPILHTRMQVEIRIAPALEIERGVHSRHVTERAVEVIRHQIELAERIADVHNVHVVDVLGTAR